MGLSRNEFAEVLSSLYYGNRGMAQQEAENMDYDNIDYSAEEYERRQQERFNTHLAICNSLCYNRDVRRYY